MRGLSRLPKENCFWGSKSICAYQFLCTGHFHGATERCDWLIVSEQGGSPRDLPIASKTSNFPLFARPRKESYQFDTPKNVAKVKDCGNILPEVKIAFAISAANSRLRARANDWLVFPRLWGLIWRRARHNLIPAVAPGQYLRRFRQMF